MGIDEGPHWWFPDLFHCSRLFADVLHLLPPFVTIHLFNVNFTFTPDNASDWSAVSVTLGLVFLATTLCVQANFEASSTRNCDPANVRPPRCGRLAVA